MCRPRQAEIAYTWLDQHQHISARQAMQNRNKNKKRLTNQKVLILGKPVLRDRLYRLSSTLIETIFFVLKPYNLGTIQYWMSLLKPNRDPNNQPNSKRNSLLSLTKVTYLNMCIGYHHEKDCQHKPSMIEYSNKYTPVSLETRRWQSTCKSVPAVLRHKVLSHSNWQQWNVTGKVIHIL